LKEGEKFELLFCGSSLLEGRRELLLLASLFCVRDCNGKPAAQEKLFSEKIARTCSEKPDPQGHAHILK
jgi:hypothetical protein